MLLSGNLLQRFDFNNCKKIKTERDRSIGRFIILGFISVPLYMCGLCSVIKRQCQVHVPSKERPQNSSPPKKEILATPRMVLVLVHGVVLLVAAIVPKASMWLIGFTRLSYKRTYSHFIYVSKWLYTLVSDALVDLAPRYWPYAGGQLFGWLDLIGVSAVRFSCRGTFRVSWLCCHSVASSPQDSVAQMVVRLPK